MIQAWGLQLKSWNYGQFSMSITRYWVNPGIWAISYQQIIGSLTWIAMYADPVIFMKLSIFAFLKSEWEFQCYPISHYSLLKPIVLLFLKKFIIMSVQQDPRNDPY